MQSKPLYEELIDDYKSSINMMSEREKAIKESEIYETFKQSLPQNSIIPNRRDWLAKELGGPEAHYEVRFTLLQSGDWVLPLWSLLPNVSYGAVIRLHRRARYLVRSGMNQNDALQFVMKDYKESGKVPKKGPPASHDQSTVQMDISVELNKKSKEFGRQITVAAMEFLDFALADVEPYIRKQLSDDFFWLSNIACDDLRRQVSRMRRDVRNEKNSKLQVRRSDFVAACEVLGYDGVYGKEINRDTYRVLWARRAASLHPDKNNGKNQTKEYDAVNQAYEILESYRQLRESVARR